MRQELHEFFAKISNKGEEDSEEKESSGKSSKQNKDREEPSLNLKRPPGWGPMYGEYEKPIIDVEGSKVGNLLSNLDETANYSKLNIRTPELGTNDEHIQIHMYTIQATDDRKLVIDVHISNFSEWLPEEKGRFSYPENTLGQNGPYYMHLEDSLREIFRVRPFAFKLIEYDEETDMAIYSEERLLYELPEE